MLPLSTSNILALPVVVVADVPHGSLRSYSAWLGEQRACFPVLYTFAVARVSIICTGEGHISDDVRFTLSPSLMRHNTDAI